MCGSPSVTKVCQQPHHGHCCTRYCRLPRCIARCILVDSACFDTMLWHGGAGHIVRCVGNGNGRTVSYDPTIRYWPRTYFPICVGGDQIHDQTVSRTTILHHWPFARRWRGETGEVGHWFAPWSEATGGDIFSARGALCRSCFAERAEDRPSREDETGKSRCGSCSPKQWCHLSDWC